MSFEKAKLKSTTFQSHQSLLLMTKTKLELKKKIRTLRKLIVSY